VKVLFIRNRQKWNSFVIRVDRDLKIKDLLLDDLNFSVRSISKMKRDKNIYKNGQVAKPTSMAKAGDIIEIEIKEDKAGFVGQDLGVAIVYEDQDLIVADKPPFMVVHPTKSHIEDTLLNYVQGIFEQKNIKSKVRFISRLDRDTSGIISIAKNPYAHYVLSQGFLKDKVRKYYTAIVNGDTSHIKESGTINAKIDKSEDGIKRVVSPTGQDAITHYKILKKNGDITVLELLLETGRTHQIRVHLRHINHPIVGDRVYSNYKES